MTRKEFNKIIKKKVRLSEFDKENHCDYNIKVDRRRLKSDRDTLICDINEQPDLDTFKENLAIMYQCHYFTEEEWDSLLPDITYLDMDAEFEKEVFPVLEQFINKWGYLGIDTIINRIK